MKSYVNQAEFYFEGYKSTHSIVFSSTSFYSLFSVLSFKFELLSKRDSECRGVMLMPSVALVKDKPGGSTIKHNTE